MEETKVPRPRLGLWLSTSLLAGAVILVLEMLAFRLYAPYFGYSIYVWGNMICVVMVALVIGYALGGWLADRSRDDGPLYWLVLFSGVYQLALLFTVHPLLEKLAGTGEVTGSILATLIVFTPPMVALATVGPYLIRLLAKEGHVGTTAGRIYALSTVGSIFGIILTTFFLVPQMGTQATLVSACATTLVVAVAGLATRKASAAAFILLLGLLPFAPPPAWAKGATYVAESAYNLILVQEDGPAKILSLNSTKGAQTIKVEGQAFTGFYFDDFLFGPVLVPAKKGLVLGMGAGSSLTASRLTSKDVVFDAVEIDPKVVDAAEKYFGIPREAPWLKVHVADARPWLMARKDRYDIVQMDLYQGGLYIPFYLATKECFRLVRDHMTDDALLMMNVSDPSQERKLLKAIGRTVSEVFPSVFVLPRGEGNRMLFAFTKKVEWSEFVGRLTEAKVEPEIKAQIGRALPHFEVFKPDADSPVLTDDHSALEEITRQALADVKH
ncbi:MAG: fused MFS/spermidine synthase [Armatimonadetes bacterium]|nr:fused MFS/spermidine synthase [Armatimonadota bacterium]